MKRLGKRSDRPVSKKYLWSFFVVVLVISILISMALFLLYSGIQIRKTTEYSAAQLKQVCVSTDILYESLEAVVNQIVVDPDTVTFLHATRINRRQEADVGIKIRSIRTANPYLRYVTLYNASSQRFVSSATAGYGQELDMAALYQRLGDQPYACYFRSIGAENNLQTRKLARAYTFLFPVRTKSDGTTDLVIIDVSDSYFNQALSPIRIPGEAQEVLLENGLGGVIARMRAQPEQAGFTTVSEEGDGLAARFALSEGTGSFTFREEGERKFVAYAQAARAGWTIYSVLPYNTLLTGLGSLVLLTVALLGVTLGFGYLISRRASSSLARPIQVLYDNYVSQENREKKGDELELLSEAFSEMYSKADRLEQGLISSYHESKNMYLQYLFSRRERRIRESLPAYKRLDIDLFAPYFAPVIIECIPRRVEEYEKEDQREANLFISYYALENVTRELVSPCCRLEFFRMSLHRFALLLYLESEAFPQGLQEALTVISDTMGREFQIDATICVGNVVSSWTDINLAYEQAALALNARTAGHYGQVFFSRDLPEAMSSDLYYNGLRDRLADLVRNDDAPSCAAEFDHAIMAMKDISFLSARSYFRHVLMSVLDEFSSAFERGDAAFSRLMEQLEQVDSCQNVQSLRSVALEFLSALSNRLSANRKSSNQDAALRAKEYIDRHFADPDLSLRMLAEIVELSPAYLGRVFTAVTTFTFNDYLNKVRTDKAAELLSATRLPISQISEQVGILNTNYFYSLFKKQYGMTPASYRKEAKAGKADRNPPSPSA